MELKYLELLSKTYTNIAKTSSEIINLQAIMNLPKGTEYFLTDIHGEYEAFSHVLRNGAGSIKRKINEIFKDSLTENEKQELATLIYYPKERLEILEKQKSNFLKWKHKTIYRLIAVCRQSCSKYSRSKVRKSMPEDFRYILEELLYEREEENNRKGYFDSIIDNIFSIKRDTAFIISICRLIKVSVVDHLHIIGDIYDRGKSPHLVMDFLYKYRNVDIQWGNHDILWMGAFLGSKACVCNAIRIACRYNNNDVLEDAYGINLLPLASFAMKVYKNDDCKSFKPKEGVDNGLVSKMHKAISIIQFKIEKNLLLNAIDYMDFTVKIAGKKYKLNDENFPTIDKNDPFKLTSDEQYVLDRLVHSFKNSEKLKRHVEFLFNKGSIYLVYNSNLLYHACIPLNTDGTFRKFEINGKYVGGREYLDELEKCVREEYLTHSGKNLDIYRFLWCDKDSPLFGKDVMRTFERYFIDDKSIHKEIKNSYYDFLNDETVVNNILSNFGLNPKVSHIINGHVPVKVKDGESPLKCNGKVLIIDGGFAKAYQKTTGIAGYTLTYNSYGMKLLAHKPFESREIAINECVDLVSEYIQVQQSSKRIKVKDTDIGKKIQVQINDLKKLLNAYRLGILKEK